MAQALRLMPSHAAAVSTAIDKPFRAAAAAAAGHRRFQSRLFSQHERRSSAHRHGAVDPGDWVFSPEWWGTQGRGWGRNPGITVFERLSYTGNGLVSVTAHPSSSGLEDWPELSTLLQGRQVATSCEWRVLRFNHKTRQSVAKVILIEDPDRSESHILQVPHCLAFEYLKSMVSVGLSSISCGGMNLELVARGLKELRCLCIGLGGGSLPLFLANKLQGCLVEVVEIDSTVISAATEFMGFPGNGFRASQQSVGGPKALNPCDACVCFQGSKGPNDAEAQMNHGGKWGIASGSLWGKVQDRINGFEADGVAFMGNLLKGMGVGEQRYDLVFVDAFDGEDEVPPCFWERGAPFLAALRGFLNRCHGTAVVNLHSDSPPPSLLERIRGEFGPGFDLHLPGGKLLQEIARTYRSELLLSPHGDGELVADRTGAAFTVAVPRQQNVCLVVSQGISGAKEALVENLRSAASRLERVLDMPFPMSKRVARGFQLVQ